MIQIRDHDDMISLTVLLIGVGLLAGLLAGLLGIGGGLVIVPVTTILLLDQGWPPEQALPTAIATSLASMLLTSASAVLSHHQRARLDRELLRVLIPGVALGALFGAWLATRLPALMMGITFTLVVFFIGLDMLIRRSPPQPGKPIPLRSHWVMGPGIGLISALMGIGGGSLVVPYLVRLRQTPVAAVAVASATGWCLALAATIGFLWMGPEYLNLHYILMIGLAGMVAAPLGVNLAHRLSASRLKRLFGLMLLAVACRMLWQIYAAT